MKNDQALTHGGIWAIIGRHHTRLLGCSRLCTCKELVRCVSGLRADYGGLRSRRTGNVWLVNLGEVAEDGLEGFRSNFLLFLVFFALERLRTIRSTLEAVGEVILQYQAASKVLLRCIHSHLARVSL